MKTFKGTQGSWLTDNAEPRKVYANNDGSHVSISIEIKRSDQENRANAKLIASAPELLEALQEITECSKHTKAFSSVGAGNLKEALNKSVKAINKAL